MLHATMPFPWSASSVLFEFDTTMHKSGITVFTKGSSIMFNEEKEKKIGKGFHFDSKQEEAFEQAGKFLFSRIYFCMKYFLKNVFWFTLQVSSERDKNLPSQRSFCIFRIRFKKNV